MKELTPQQKLNQLIFYLHLDLQGELNGLSMLIDLNYKEYHISDPIKKLNKTLFYLTELKNKTQSAINKLQHLLNP
jgi:hypothetical protein